MPDSLQPADRIRRSNLYRVSAALGARWADVNGFACAANYGEAAGEAAAATTLGIADLTALPRAGYKGWDMATWVGGQGVDLGEPNTARVQADGTLACRLSGGELLLLADDAGDGGTMDTLAAAWSMEGAVCYPVPRSDTNARIGITGAKAPGMMAKMCGIDLRPHRFANHRIAQTSVARMNAILIRNDRGETYALDMVIDSASIVYMWECLTDAMAEFDGRAIGLDALRGLSA
ncbi:MAG: sarcosine oxidase [Rhodospirillales bacterium]|nr:sarcosine oxidase [Rhodospirillales bacterium]